MKVINRERIEVMTLREGAMKFFIRIYLGWACLLIISVSMQVKAQVSPQSPMSGTTPLALQHGGITGSYPLSDFDSISPFSGKLDIAFPLLRVGGRGDASYTMMTTIHAKPWHYEPYVDPILGLITFADPGDVFPQETSGYEPLRVYVRAVRVPPVSPDCDSLASDDDQWWLTRIAVVTADGSEIILRDVNNQGKIWENNCFLHQSGLNRGTNFVSTDGSAMTFISDANIQDSELQPPLSGYLMTRDGVRYRIEASRVRWMRDRNGNVLTFSYDSELALQTITDSLNRKITFQYMSSVGAYFDQISFSGFGGATRTIKVWHSNMGSVLRADQQLKSFRDLEIGDSDQLWDTDVISAIELPNGKKYQFKYNSYADVARVELPTGGAYEYDHAGVLVSSGSTPRNGLWVGLFRKVTEKRIYPDGVNLERITTFTPTYSIPPGYSTPYVSYSGYSASTSVDIDDLDAQRRLLSRVRHYYIGVPFDSVFKSSLDYPGWKEGRETKTEYFATNGTTVLRRVQMTTQQRASVSWWSQWLTNGMAMALRADYEPSNDPRLTETVTTLVDTNQVSKTSAINPSDQSVGFDQFNNQTDVWEYDFGTGSPGSLKRRTHTTYLTTSSYINANTNVQLGSHLRSLPTMVQTFDGANNEKSRTVFEYDTHSGDFHAALVPRSAISGMCALVTSPTQCDNTNPGVYTNRGNATAITSSLLVNGVVDRSISRYQQYDVAGNMVKIIDPRSTLNNIIASEFDFSDAFGVADNEARNNTAPLELSQPGQASYAFPTKITNALGHITYLQYDYYLGKPVNSEDANQIVSNASYDDLLDRPTQVRLGLATNAANQRTFIYNDTDRIIRTTSDLDALDDNKLKTETSYDGLGRVTEERRFLEGADYIAVRQVPFVSVQDGTVWRPASRVSNPFRPLLLPPNGDEQLLWTTSLVDSLDRPIKITTPDNALISTSYLGNEVTVTDQAGKTRKSISDALGRLRSVYENPGGLNFLTTYDYDTLNCLTTVSQGTQTPRSFVCDSLGRMTSASNPESGTSIFEYDDNNNLIHKTDARGVTITYVYDALNRITSRTYSDSTPAVSFDYDAANVANSKGLLTSISSSISSYSYGGYDPFGRVLSGSQVTDGQSYSMTYTYNRAGRLKTQTYPSGRVVTSEYDDSGRLAGVKNPASGLFYVGAAATDSVQRIQYTSHGAAKTMKLGNGLWQHTDFNSRLQVTQIGVGTSSSDSSVLKLDYTYGELVGGNLDPTKNNGDVQSQTITLPGISAIVQNYEYDELNRLKKAQEVGTNGWTEQFSYDQFGNRTNVTVTDNPASKLPTSVPDIDPANNRIKVLNTQSQPTGFGYDGAGNLTQEPEPGSTLKKYIYDAESRLIQAKRQSGATETEIGAYHYDGEGRRVKASS